MERNASATPTVERDGERAARPSSSTLDAPYSDAAATAAIDPELTIHAPSSEAPPLHRLELPTTVNRHRIVWPYAIGIIGVHVLALLAFVPYFFSWSGVVLAFMGLYVFGTLGINLCYHRLLTHGGFSCPKWLEHVFATLGVCCLQDTPARWVATHRLHHQHSDERPDPHSPLVTFFWGHVGWLMVENSVLSNAGTYDRYARDILRDPFYMRMERGLWWVWVNLMQGVVFFVAGAAVGALWTQTAAGAVQLGSSWVVWGVLVRLVAVWHITWSVNSATHMWGYRNYDTDENSRNNWVVALVSNGEGWHNNHHADQRSAAHGHRWWEFDVTYTTIRVLQLLGLAHDVVTPRERALAKIAH